MAEYLYTFDVATGDYKLLAEPDPDGTVAIVEVPEEIVETGQVGEFLAERDSLDGPFYKLASGPQGRLEALRAALRAENISYGELAELQSLAEHIEPGDVELLEAAGVPEFPDDTDQGDQRGAGGYPISENAEVTEMPPGTGWSWLVKDGDDYWGVNEDPGEKIPLSREDYEHDLSQRPQV